MDRVRRERARASGGEQGDALAPLVDALRTGDEELARRLLRTCWWEDEGLRPALAEVFEQVPLDPQVASDLAVVTAGALNSEGWQRRHLLLRLVGSADPRVDLRLREWAGGQAGPSFALDALSQPPLERWGPDWDLLFYADPWPHEALVVAERLRADDPLGEQVWCLETRERVLEELLCVGSRGVGSRGAAASEAASIARQRAGWRRSDVDWRPAWVPLDLPTLRTRDRLTGCLREAHSAGGLNLRSVMESTPALLCVDVDGLQSVNGGHGPVEGDRELQRLARLLRRHAGDRVVRTGGDEFHLPWEGQDPLALAEELVARSGEGGHTTIRIVVDQRPGPREERDRRLHQAFAGMPPASVRSTKA